MINEAPEATRRSTGGSNGNGRSPVRVRAARAALLSDDATSLMEQVRQVFCEPTRSQIMRALSTGPLSVNDLALVIGRSKSATSQHLRILREDGMVTARRRGRSVFYAVDGGTAATCAIDAINAVVRAA